MRLVRLLFLSSLLILPAFASHPNLGLQDGEILNYRVAWGIFFHAGEITITARAGTSNNLPCTIVRTTTSTRGMLRRLFYFEARAESLFDHQSGRMLSHTESSEAKRKKTNTALEFNYANSTATYTDLFNAANNQVVEVPPGNPMDLIMSLVQTRVWDLKPGEMRDTDVVFGNEIYELTVHALRYETLDTALGTFKTLVLEPRMEKTPAKGMFKRGSQVHVWITQNDEQHLPVMFEVEFSFGAGIATLVKYQPPASMASSAATAKSPRS